MVTNSPARLLWVLLACVPTFACTTGYIASPTAPASVPANHVCSCGDSEIEVHVEAVTVHLGLPCWVDISVRNTSPVRPLFIDPQLTLIRSQGIAFSESPDLAVPKRSTSLSFLPPNMIIGGPVSLEPGEQRVAEILLTDDLVFLAEGVVRVRFEIPFKRPTGVIAEDERPSVHFGEPHTRHSVVVLLPVVTPSWAKETRVIGNLMVRLHEELKSKKTREAEGDWIPLGSSADILGTLASDRRLPEFQQLATHEHPEVRIFALGVFASMPTGAGIADLQAAVSDADERVASAALDFLSDLLIPVDEAGLAAVTSRGWSQAVHSLWRNLVGFPAPASRRRLMELTKHADERIARDAALSLETLTEREEKGWPDVWPPQR